VVNEGKESKKCRVNGEQEMQHQLKALTRWDEISIKRTYYLFTFSLLHVIK
jgi:hypothetical protein